MGWFTRKPVEERSASTDTTVPPRWDELTGGYTYAGVPVTQATATGLPAVGAAIRLISETIGMLPLNVYRGRMQDKRLADQSWQYRLLAELPGMGDFTPMDLLSDVVACLEAGGNAYLQKVKAAGEVIALLVIDPARVRDVREGGAKLFKVRTAEGHENTYSSSTILHIRGFTFNGADVGVSPITLHRQKLGAIIAQDEYQGRFYGQGTHTDIALKSPAGTKVGDDDAEKFHRRWRSSKAGLGNMGQPLLLAPGTDLIKLGMSQQDAQFVEGEKMNLLQAAHIFRLPPKFLTGESGLTEWDFLSLYTLSLQPRMKRIEMAMFSDPDLFPQRIIYPEFDTRPLLRTDAKTKAEVEHIQIQDGSKLVDEIRAERGEAPLPAIPDDPTKQPGSVPQMTPVGGAPNPAQEPSVAVTP